MHTPRQLQRIQNSVAWLVLKKHKPDHIILLLNELHWLPVKFMCEYKIALLCTITLTVHSSLTFQLCSAHIKLHAPSDPQVKSFWWASIQFHHSVCLESAACQSAKYSLSVSSKPSPRLSSLNRSFHKPRQTILVTIDYLYACVYIRMSLSLSVYIYSALSCHSVKAACVHFPLREKKK